MYGKMNKTPQSRVRILTHIEQTTSGNKSVALNMRYTKIKVYVFPCEKTGKETIFRLQADRLQVYVVHLCIFGRQPVHAWTKSFLIHHVVANAMARGIICLLVWISAEVHHFSVKNEKRSVTRFRGF